MSLLVQVGTADAPADRFGSPDAAVLASRLRSAVEAALRTEAYDDAEISLTLLADAAIAALNERYLDHEGPTDVLSFTLHEPGESPLGDVYIGWEQALRQAERLDVPAAEELVRLAVHGTLHVLGHDHPAGEAREASEMWTLQERIVRSLVEAG